MRRLSLILALALGLSAGAVADGAFAKAHAPKPTVCKDAKGKKTPCPAGAVMVTSSKTAPTKPAPSAAKPTGLMAAMPGMKPALKPAPAPPAPKPVAKPAASPAPAAGGHCKDANGKFIKCPTPAAHAKGVHCRDAKGKFIKCSAA